jgi:hypothetical protein
MIWDFWEVFVEIVIKIVIYSYYGVKYGILILIFVIAVSTEYILEFIWNRPYVIPLFIVYWFFFGPEHYAILKGWLLAIKRALGF